MHTFYHFLAVLSIAASLPACDGTIVKPVEIIDIDVPEPSGLAFDPVQGSLWTVSDKTGDAYKLDLAGEVTERLDLDLDDPEGIAIKPGEEISLITAEESKDHVELYDGKGERKGKWELGMEGHSEHGWEGLAYREADSVLFLVRERSPVAILTFSPSRGKMIAQLEVPFCADLSGIACDPLSDRLWLLSDEDRTVSLASPEGALLKMWYHGIPKGEGIAIDTANSRMYIVSDTQSKLYTFDLAHFTY